MENIRKIMDYGKDQWVLPGYTVAKTKHYISKSISFSSSKKNTINLSDTERSKYPDPAKYAETIEKTFEKHWKKPFGGFSKLKKTNYLDEIIKRSKSTPGPGSYIKPLLTPNIDSGRRSPLGKFE